MRGEENSEHLDELKQRLYERGQQPPKRKRTDLTDEKREVARDWSGSDSDAGLPFNPSTPKQKTVLKTDISPKSVSPAPEPSIPPPPMSPVKKKRAYRFKLILAGLVFFVAAVGLSSLFILFGGNAISGENIEVSITGPFTIGGGENLPLQIGVTNANTIPIESATLIIEYPAGTQSADDDGRELFIDRIPLDVIEAGETVNIPVRAQVFGEENSELMIRASVEYRVRGSNATFFKEAQPLTFKISSSPVVVTIDSVENLSAGQETTITVNIKSNAPETLSDLVLRAEYPSSFDFTQSSPAPASGQNIWTIDSLDPEGTTEVEIKGVFIGNTSEEFAMNFSIGVPNERNAYTLASIFAIASADFVIEDAFLDIGVSVDGVRNDIAVIEPGDQAQVNVEITNTLGDAVYDAVVELKLSGNALNGADIGVNQGHYDSNTRTIIWDISSERGLEQILPGESVTFRFSLEPSESTAQTPQISMETTVQARRVSEASAEEQLVGTYRSSMRVESAIAVRSETGYNIGAFNDSGPVPPMVGESTTYTITWQAVNGSNNISDSVVTATLPTYVTWTDQTAGSGVFNYNPSTRQVEWRAGSLSANSQVLGSFQVSILPSASQIDTTPTLVGEQNMRAEDDFTNTVLRARKSALTTKMSEEAGYSANNGRVQPN